MKKTLLILIFLWAGMLLSHAQEESSDQPFNGLITNLAGRGVKVKISVKHSNKRTVSDKSGKFGLTNVSPDDTLILTQKGRTIQIPIEGRKSLKVVWTSDTPTYEEDQALVDTGFGYIKRREYTSSSSNLTGEMMIKKGYSDVQVAVLALVPGLQLINGEIMIRGIGSINSANKALILFDGIPINSLQGLDIHDVESVEVQKGSNMYGLRGGNGVIIVRSKKK